MYPVSPEKERALALRMQKLQIFECDIIERYTRGTGKGGQKRNKTETCVQLQHKSSGIEVRCDTSRSQAMNRFLARRLLCDKLEELLLGQKSQAAREISKIRRQKARRSRRSKANLVENKRQRTQRIKDRKVDSSS